VVVVNLLIVIRSLEPDEDLDKLSEKLLVKVWKLMSWTKIWFMIEHYQVI
jgi:hypothetical protein